MGFSDRDYARPGDDGRGGPGGPPRSPFGRGRGGPTGPRMRFRFGPPAGISFFALILIAVNVVVFLLDLLLKGLLTEWGAFSVKQGVFGGQVWRFLTATFLHAGPWHLLVNMLGLFFFAADVERYLGSARFLAFYLLCGLVSIATFAVAYPVLPGVGAGTTAVGASGSLFGVLVGAACIAPDRTVMLLLPPIPMKMRTLTWLIVGLAAANVLYATFTGEPGRNTGGEAAHLGGALLGFLLIRKPSLLNFATAMDPAAARVKRAKRRGAAQEAEIDRILIKVKEQGLQSLTDKERKTLQQGSDGDRRAG